VDHRVIFRGFEQALPTFNSLSIETLLWRIPGLSNQFIYFNDDEVLLRRVAPTDFFNEGRMVLRGAWKKPRIPAWWNGWRVVEPHRKIQEQTANRLGFSDRYFDLIHAPHALHKSFFEACDAEHPDWFFENGAYPFRDAQQFWPIGLIAHWAISRHQAEFKSNKSGVMIHAGHHSERVIKARLAKVAADASIQFACLQSMDEGSAACQKSLFHWLDQYIPSWESLINL
jgi:hypothetical protein